MSTDVVRTVGRRTLELRDRAGLSQRVLAQQAGVNVSTIQALELGTATGANLHTLTALAQALQVPVGVLLGERPIPVAPHWNSLLARVLVEAEQILEVA